MARTLFTSRFGGVSPAPYDTFNLALHVGDQTDSVQANRKVLAKTLGLPFEKVFFMNQVHGNSVAVIGESADFHDSPVADALFTLRDDVALTVLVADCIPLLLQSSRAIAAVHVGRKGLVAEVLEETLRVFNAHGIETREIKAEVGPAICGRCYEVDQSLYDEVVKGNPATATTFISQNQKPCLDLVAGLTERLLSVGITVDNLHKCTFHDEGYFSYRREGVTGRQAGAITLAQV